MSWFEGDLPACVLFLDASSEKASLPAPQVPVTDLLPSAAQDLTSRHHGEGLVASPGRSGRLSLCSGNPGYMLDPGFLVLRN